MLAELGAPCQQRLREATSPKMSSKVANIIAIELGILIALLGWLAVARIPSVRLGPRMHEPTQADATFAPVLRSPPKDLYATNENAARRARAQWPEEVAPAYEAQQYQAPQYDAADYGATEYESAGEPSDSPQGYLYEPSPSYLSDQLEPVLPPDYYYQPSGDFVEFVQPAQVVVFSNNRSHPRSRRSQVCSSPRRAMPSRLHSGGSRKVARGGGMSPRQGVTTSPTRQRPAHAGTVASRGANRTVGQVGNGRARGGPISVLQ